VSKDEAGGNADGRTARRDRNRELVLDAVLALFAEGHLSPTPQQVAERSGVSLRSVFRYYEDTGALLRAAMGRHLELVRPLREIPDLGKGAFDDRVERFVAAQLRLYRAIAPTARAGLIRAATNDVIAERFAAARRERLERLEAMFDLELRAMPLAKRRMALAIVDTMFQFESMEHLHERLQLSDRKTAEALRHTLRTLFGSAAED
jgi:AcrR family transcriptional regulator